METVFIWWTKLPSFATFSSFHLCPDIHGTDVTGNADERCKISVWPTWLEIMLYKVVEIRDIFCQVMAWTFTTVLLRHSTFVVDGYTLEFR